METDSDGFTKLPKKQIDWSAQETRIECACGLVVDLDYEVVVCDCGRAYRVIHLIQVKEVPNVVHNPQGG